MIAFGETDYFGRQISDIRNVSWVVMSTSDDYRNYHTCRPEMAISRSEKSVCLCNISEKIAGRKRMCFL